MGVALETFINLNHLTWGSNDCLGDNLAVKNEYVIETQDLVKIYKTGKVKAVGPGKLLDNGKRGEMAVKKNDLVIYGKYGGSEVEVNGKTLKILRESEILGIVED